MVEKLINDPSDIKRLLAQIHGWDMTYPYLEQEDYRLLIILLTVLAGDPEVKGWKKGVGLLTMINSMYLMKEEEYNAISDL